jgi:dienelactone hydrolase
MPHEYLSWRILLSSKNKENRDGNKYIDYRFGYRSCILTKSNQKNARSFLRLGAFAVFVIFTLVSVIEWSFRWYGIAALLLIWAALGAWSLLRKKEEKNEYRPGRIVFKAIAVLPMVAIAVTPALIFPQHDLPPMTGEYQVATVTYTYTDTSRIETFTDTGENRKVNVGCWYPENSDGKYPLVVFSHGAFGVRASNTTTFMELASNGYVVCSIDHPYHSIFTQDASGKLTMFDQTYFKEYNNLNTDIDEATKHEYWKKWMKVRTDDMNFVLDTIIDKTNNQNADAIYQMVDTDKIGVSGHSLGGATAAAIGRERDDIDAVVNLDGPLLGELTGLADGKYVMSEEPSTFPLLNIYSDDLWGQMQAGSEYSANVLLKSNTPANVYNVNFEGAKHLNLTDLPLLSPMLAGMLQGGSAAIDKYSCIVEMNSTILAFFDNYLKSEGIFTSPGTD